MNGKGYNNFLCGSNVQVAEGFISAQNGRTTHNEKEHPFQPLILRVMVVAEWILDVLYLHLRRIRV
jgi:hypothetical protein